MTVLMGANLAGEVDTRLSKMVPTGTLAEHIEQILYQVEFLESRIFNNLSKTIIDTIGTVSSALTQ